MDSIHIIPVGNISGALIDEVVHTVRSIFRDDTTVERVLPVPENTYFSPRGQYHSTAMLRWLRTFYPQKLGYRRILGIADVDLFVPQLNFVFGEADRATRTSVISVVRLRDEFYGGLPDESKFLRRAAKEAVHELGHTYGLGHCDNPRCIMFFSNSLTDTDRKGPGFCATCKGLLSSDEDP